MPNIVYEVKYIYNDKAMVLGLFSSWQRAYYQMKLSILAHHPDGSPTEGNPYSTERWEIMQAMLDRPATIIYHSFSEYADNDAYKPSLLYQKFVKEIENGYEI
jgi:hypothetical protein